jgi:hypothetical protein
MINRAIWIALTLSLFGFIFPAAVRADEHDKKTVLTFSQPVEIPGQVLPAGTYTFKLADTMSDRHIVQIFNADESQIIATVMAISDYRLTTTDQTVIKFSEVPAGSPEAIRAWFYPGNTIGQEFVYPKTRATQLAKAAKAVVPALAIDVADANALKTARIVAITPEEKEMPVAAAIQMTPGEGVATVATARHLPQTASILPLLVVFGLGSIGVAFGLMVLGKRAPAVAIAITPVV